MTPFPYRGASRTSLAAGQACGGLCGAEPMVTRLCVAKHCGDIGPASEVVGGDVGAAVCVLVVCNTRALSFLPSPTPHPCERRGGETAAAAAAAAVLTSGTLLSPLRQIGSSFPLPLTVCCVFDVLKQEREHEQRHEQHYRRPQHCGPGPQRRAGWRRWRRWRRWHRGNPGD